jgi:ATP-dependent Lhr-like helicase
MASQHRFNPAIVWFKSIGWKPQHFQLEVWEACYYGYSGLLCAPTGSGKTYALLIPFLQNSLVEKSKDASKGLQLIWITPIRALAKEIAISAQRAVEGLGSDWQIGIRTGDTTQHIRKHQLKNMPQMLITTPESLQLLLSNPSYPQIFKHLKGIVVDEWHEMIGSKRGVQMQLALSLMKALLPALSIWGISATIGNLDEASEVLFGDYVLPAERKRINANIEKKIIVHTMIPDKVDTYPWAGHLGLRMAERLIPLLQSGHSTLIFTNTRAQCEIWYRHLLELLPSLAGQMAMHHGSMSREIRDWVENALYEGTLKVVVCTSSLDLGVDFRPVDNIIQVGSPKGIARFLQRAGRSGHQPGGVSQIYFLPTHALEMLEGAALREAISGNEMESRIPPIRCFDVLVQYLVTRAIGAGFVPDIAYEEIKKTFAYRSITKEEWHWVLAFIRFGGNSLQAYPEYAKVEVQNGIWLVTDKVIAKRHRLQIGTIVSDPVLQVKFVKGGFLGSVEEWFISSLKPGEVFWFAGQALSLVRIKDMTVQVKKSKETKGKIPSWQGGRLPLSSELGRYLRNQIYALNQEDGTQAPEIQALRPLIKIQQMNAAIPQENEFLLEYFTSKEGFHLTCYPFEGRLVHEGLGSLVAWRLSKIKPQSFSIAMNDYGIEWLSDTPIDIHVDRLKNLFTTENLLPELRESLNSMALASRRFRDIASISGLLFKGYPGNNKKDRHLQASGELFFKVFQDYEPDNLLLMQAYEEALLYQMEEIRLHEALKRIEKQSFLLKNCNKATPFAFPIMVDRLREKLSSEKLEDRIKKMTLLLEKQG